MAICWTYTAILWILNCWIVYSAAKSILVTDLCDWTGSGLHQSEPNRGVLPIYLRCSQGRVEWNYPRGALRILLRHGTSGRDFRGCIRVAANSSGARIYLEGHRKLYPLYSKGDSGDINRIKCFNSFEGRLALYVESEHLSDLLRKETAGFSYDLRIIPKDARDDLEECRPCTEDEMLTYFCTSDWVLLGTVSSLYHNNNLQETEMTIRVSSVLRHSGELDDLWRQKNELAKNFNDANYTVIHRPLKCGTKSGSGEYVFMGRWMLGNPTVHCVPRYSEWKKIRRKALSEGTNQCQLD